MAVGRKPQPQERAFGDEVIGVAYAALAVFLILAFSSYRPGDAQPNQMGLVGHVVADFVCPMLGKACYLLPAALLYGTAVLLHLLPCPAPFSQMLSFLFFTPAVATFLALWYED
ncbi:MAG TPA: DNA translocase FtsK 4TM domain-containing protein, partial [Candidatus Binatia bacterium]|nr:DNA translocase FtsK 4TM domain-containing protein [Candidatus Binatia bacterium]